MYYELIFDFCGYVPFFSRDRSSITVYEIVNKMIAHSLSLVVISAPYILFFPQDFHIVIFSLCNIHYSLLVVKKGGNGVLL